MPISCVRAETDSGIEAVLEPPADGILSGPETPRHRFVDHHDLRRARRQVAVLQQAAAKQRDAHRLEIAGHDLIFGQRRSGIIRPPGRLALERDAIVGLPVNEEVRDGSDGHDARQRTNSPRRLREERRPLCGIVVFAGKVDLQQQHVARVEATVGCLHAQEAANQQPGSRQQDHRERDLGHHQPLVDATPASSAKRARAALAQDLRGIRGRQL
jgi:hypothetical protein